MPFLDSPGPRPLYGARGAEPYVDYVSTWLRKSERLTQFSSEGDAWNFEYLV